MLFLWPNHANRLTVLLRHPEIDLPPADNNDHSAARSSNYLRYAVLLGTNEIEATSFRPLLRMRKVLVNGLGGGLASLKVGGPKVPSAPDRPFSGGPSFRYDNLRVLFACQCICDFVDIAPLRVLPVFAH